MEPQHHLQQQQQQNEDVGSSSGNRSSFLCRQSSTRWTPTADQIRILKDLYYNNGVRSPSAEQIQRISARLRQYGKIEGKNVFYWFQNHKARERQKKRFSVETSMQRGVGNCGWKPEDSVHLHKYTNINPGEVSLTETKFYSLDDLRISRPSSPSSHGVLAAGHGYGSLLMENSFRDCSISAGGNGCEGYDLGWFGMDPYSSSRTPLDKRKSNNSFEEETPEIETLPLFPVHGEDIAGFCMGKPDSCWYRRDDERGSSRTSLELTLNSYAGESPGST